MITTRFQPHKSGTTLLKQEFVLETVSDGPVDLSNAIVKIQMRTSTEGPVEKQFISTTGGGITITDATAGKFEIDEQILTLPPFDYICALRISYSDGTEDEPMEWIWPITVNAVQ